MTPDRFRLIAELYDAALTMTPGERTRFIEERCANDDELRRELIEVFRQTGSTLAGIVGKAAAAAVDGGDQWTGLRVGKYRILRIVGEGGMGVVYEANRGFEGHPAMPSAELLRRFERESQVLARLQHPGIAQISRILQCSLSAA